MNSSQVVCVLTIAGTDAGGGAGIQADLKTFAAHRVHGLSVAAALTGRHTRRVTALHVPDPGFRRAQIDPVSTTSASVRSNWPWTTAVPESLVRSAEACR